MKISVITVCFNAKETIEQMFVSLKNQTYKDIEHIVIDGVSTDGTLDVINNYKENISHFVSEKDTGIYNAMNKGLKYVTGDIVYFLNATDSLYDNNVFDKVANEFNKHSDLEMLWGDIEFTETGKEPRIHKNNNFNSKFDLMYNNPCHQAIFYGSNLFKSYQGYDESIPIFADWEFNARMLVSHDAKCKYIPEVLASFEIGGISTSSDDKIRIKHRNDTQMIFEKIFSKKFYFRADKFFTKNFASIVRITKNSELYRILLRKKLSLNMIGG